MELIYKEQLLDDIDAHIADRPVTSEPRREEAIVMGLSLAKTIINQQESISVEEHTAQLVRHFHDKILDRYGATDDTIIQLLDRTQWHWLPELPKPHQDVLLEYSTKAGDIRRVVARYTGSVWSGHPHCPIRWMFLPE